MNASRLFTKPVRSLHSSGILFLALSSALSLPCRYVSSIRESPETLGRILNMLERLQTTESRRKADPNLATM